MLTLGLNFFVLSTEYKKYQLTIQNFLIKHGYTYHDFLIIPIHERTNIINQLLDNEN